MYSNRLRQEPFQKLLEEPEPWSGSRDFIAAYAPGTPEPILKWQDRMLRLFVSDPELSPKQALEKLGLADIVPLSEAEEFKERFLQSDRI